jgi:ribosomal protein L37AE/L43A
MGDEHGAQSAFVRCLEIGGNPEAEERANALLKEYGKSGLICDHCKKELDVKTRKMVAGKWVCPECEQTMREELTNQVQEAEAEGLAALKDIKRKAKKKKMIQAGAVSVLGIVVLLALMRVLAADTYNKIRKYAPILPAIKTDAPKPPAGSNRAPQNKPNNTVPNESVEGTKPPPDNTPKTNSSQNTKTDPKNPNTGASSERKPSTANPTQKVDSSANKEPSKEENLNASVKKEDEKNIAQPEKPAPAIKEPTAPPVAQPAVETEAPAPIKKPFRGFDLN